MRARHVLGETGPKATDHLSSVLNVLKYQPYPSPRFYTWLRSQKDFKKVQWIPLTQIFSQFKQNHFRANDDMRWRRYPQTRTMLCVSLKGVPILCKTPLSYVYICGTWLWQAWQTNSSGGNTMRSYFSGGIKLSSRFDCNSPPVFSDTFISSPKSPPVTYEKNVHDSLIFLWKLLHELMLIVGLVKTLSQQKVLYWSRFQNA